MESIKNITRAIDRINGVIGNIIAWCAIYMVVVQFVVVVLRYVFSLGFIAIVESVWYAHGMLFMIGAGYTLLKDGHVRVDVFYREAAPRKKAWIDLIGSIIFIMPLAILTIYFSWGYIINAWKVLEVSSEAGGMPIVYLYKSVIWVFAALIGLQGLSMALKAWVFLSGHSDEDYNPALSH